MSYYEQKSTPLGVDMEGVQDYEGYDDSPLPDGDYPVFVDKAELRTSNYSGNKYLSVTYKVAEGQYRGRVIFDTFAMWGNNSMVAKSRFKSLRRQLGLNPNTSGTVEELLGKCTVTVKVRARRNDASRMENHVTMYKPYTSSQQSAAPTTVTRPAAPYQQAPAAPMQAAPQAAASDYPW